MTNMVQQALTSHVTKSKKHERLLAAREKTSDVEDLWKPSMFFSFG